MRRGVLITALFFLMAPTIGSSGLRDSRAACVISGLLSATKRTTQLYTGKLTTKLDATSFSIFDKVRLDPAVALTDSEREWIEKRGLTKSLADYRATGSWIRETNQWLALRKRLNPIDWKSVSWKQRAWKWLREYFLLGFGPSNTARKIFGKFIDNPAAELTPSELVFIRKWRLDSELARFRQDLEINRKGFAVISRINQVGRAIRWTVLGGTAATSVVMGQTLHQDLQASESFDPNGPNGLKPTGEVDLLVPNNVAEPPVLVVGGGTYVFSPVKVGLELTASSETLKKMKMNNTPHFRIRFNATPQQVLELSDHMEKYIEAARGQPLYFDAPDAEIFRILKQEFGLPPLPVVNRMNKPLVNFFKVLQAVGGSKSPVQKVYRVGHVEAEKSLVKEVAGDALGGIWGADMYFGTPWVVLPLAAYDEAPSTIHNVGH